MKIFDALKGKTPPINSSVVLVTGLLIAAVWFVALERSNHERVLAISEEVTKNSNLAQSHEERATRSLQVLDQILLAIRDDYAQHGLPRSLNDRLVALKVDRKYVGVVSLIDTRGMPIASTFERLSDVFSDRDYFKNHAADSADYLLIGKPIVGKVSGKWIIPLTRRIYLADGSFGGVVFMALDPAFLATDYLNTEQGPNGAMALIGLDGITRARRNADKISFGEDVRTSQLFKEITKAPQGTYTGVAASDGQRRIASYRVLKDFPMVVLVASSQDAVLKRSKERERTFIGTAATSTVLLLAMAGVIGMGRIRRRRERTVIEDSERRYRMLFESSQDAVFTTTPSGQVLSANPAASAMFGLDVIQLQKMKRVQLFDPADARLALLLEDESCDGKMRGEVSMVRGDGSHFEAELSSTCYDRNHEVSSLIVRDITQRRTAEAQIQNLAFYDPLTQLPNRRLLMDRLHQAQAASARHRRKGALLFIDLDNFKIINDTLGHHQGDILLQQVAKRLPTCLREGDTCARLGGDEFVVMLEDLSESLLEASIQAEIVGKKIGVTLNQNYQLGSGAYRSTSSIGITLFGGDVQEGIDEPLKRADLAMYQAKDAGRNTVRFFDPKVQEAVAVRAVLEADLRQAVQEKQFLLYYQPQFYGKDQMTGVEALVRWQHPKRGMVSPAEFIPLAEDTGLIFGLGQWVLEEACAQLASWAAQPTLSHLTVAVNVSAHQFHQPDFVDQVQTVLTRTGAQAQKLKLELTEGLLLTNIEEVIVKMTAIKALGVGFSLDDFGTGYSSLSYLKKLPLDQLKIDQSFVQDILVDPNDAAIAKMVIVLAESLGLTVIAEGVETEAQRDFLAHHGCHACQGYFFSRPLSIQALEAFVER